MLRKVFLPSLILSGVFIANTASAATEPIQVYVNQERLQFDTDPVIENGTTLVPFRTIFEKLGLEVTWDDHNRTIQGKKGTLGIQLQLGNSTVYVNEEPKTIATPPQIINNRTFVPLRFIGEFSGASVEWDADSRTISITTPIEQKIILSPPSPIRIDVAEPSKDQVYDSLRNWMQFNLFKFKSDSSVPDRYNFEGEELKELMQLYGYQDIILADRMGNDFDIPPIKLLEEKQETNKEFQELLYEIKTDQAMRDYQQFKDAHPEEFRLLLNEGFSPGEIYGLYLQHQQEGKSIKDVVQNALDERKKKAESMIKRIILKGKPSIELLNQYGLQEEDGFDGLTEEILKGMKTYSETSGKPLKEIINNLKQSMPKIN